MRSQRRDDFAPRTRSKKVRPEAFMAQLMLLRHAKSDWTNDSLSDFQRPLNPRGKKAAPQVADWLKRHHAIPDRILCSTAQRARETLECMQARWKEDEDLGVSDQPIDVHFLDPLYLAPPQTILEVAIENANGVSSLLLIGHNPGLEMLATQLSDRVCEMPTAALAIFRSEPSWPDDWWDSSCWKAQDFFVPKRG
jgi:phosphohistidine phosphatase